MRHKNVTYILVLVVLLALGFGVGRLSAAGPQALGGSLDSPGPPESTYLYTLEDVYNRLLNGAAGAPTAFTEPSAGPTAGTGHSLSEIMAQAPTVDDANGATSDEVANGKTAWGLTSGQWGLLTGTLSAPVPKTGQTISHTVGDDGDLEMGVAWPNPRFTDNSDGTVTDNLTGLIWLTNANCANATRPWATALTDVASLNSAGTMNDNNCGDTSNGGSWQTDWRLPNVREMHSLAHYSFIVPAVPNTAGTGQWSAGDPFTGVKPEYYWSSTSYVSYTANAWRVGLYYGFVNMGTKTNSYYVWPVRAGQ